MPIEISCCLGPNNRCVEFAGGQLVRCLLDTFVEGGMFNLDGECVPGEISRNVPALGEWGMIAMAGILGIAALLILRRKRADI